MVPEGVHLRRQGRGHPYFGRWVCPFDALQAARQRSATHAMAQELAAARAAARGADAEQQRLGTSVDVLMRQNAQLQALVAQLQVRVLAWARSSHAMAACLCPYFGLSACGMAAMLHGMGVAGVIKRAGLKARASSVPLSCFILKFAHMLYGRTHIGIPDTMQDCAQCPQHLLPSLALMSHWCGS